MELVLLPVGSISTSMTCSLRSVGITPLPRYNEAVRPWPAHRYFRPRGFSAENVIEADQKRHVVSDLSYAGDEGGIVCHLSCSQEAGRALVVSLTHVRVSRSMPLAA